MKYYMKSINPVHNNTKGVITVFSIMIEIDPTLQVLLEEEEEARMSGGPSGQLEGHYRGREGGGLARNLCQ